MGNPICCFLICLQCFTGFIYFSCSCETIYQLSLEYKITKYYVAPKFKLWCRLFWGKKVKDVMLHNKLVLLYWKEVMQKSHRLRDTGSV